MDNKTPAERSKNMAAIKSSGTKDEVIFAKALWKCGLRYRKNNRTVFGKPDFTFKKFKIAVFIDSEFFHGKDWETRKRPDTNADFWFKKISRNIERDKEVNNYLQNSGWIVIRFWSTELRKNTDLCIQIVKTELLKRQNLPG
jgi:DNA mismatch endonuclease, patch repair protein